MYLAEQNASTLSAKGAGIKGPSNTHTSQGDQMGMPKKYSHEEYKKRQREQADARRAEWRRKGLCIMCGRETPNIRKIVTISDKVLEDKKVKTSLCFDHLIEYRARQRNRNAQQTKAVKSSKPEGKKRPAQNADRKKPGAKKAQSPAKGKAQR